MSLRWKLAAIFAALSLSPCAMAEQGAAPAQWTPADGDRLVFDVFRNGEPFGSHVVVFRRSGDTLTVDTDIELKVALGPLVVFHYLHDATEVWAGDRLASVVAKTKNEGRWSELAAQATEAGLKISGRAFKGVREGQVIPSTHWNVAEMKQAAMLSTETGAMLPMTVTDKGVETVKLASGEVEARRYHVKSEMEATFWYDAAGRWVKCAFKTKGQNVEYVLRDLPA
jgi:hypothetical protein